MCRDWSALMGFTAMAKLTRKMHNLFSPGCIQLSQFQDFRLSPRKTYCISNAARRGWVVVEVEDNDYYGGGGALCAFAIRRDQARRMRADLRAERRAAMRNSARDTDRPLLAFDFEGDDTPF